MAVRRRRARLVVAGLVSVVALGGAPGTKAEAFPRGTGPIALGCTSSDGTPTMAVTLPEVSSTAPGLVPEDGAALVSISVPLPAVASPGALVTEAHLTFALLDPVGDVDLTFAGGTIPGRDWDARGGQAIVIDYLAPQPVPFENATLATVTQIFTFDPGSAGTTVAWPSFRSMSVSLDEAGRAVTWTCTPTSAVGVLGSTTIGRPTAPHQSVIPASEAGIRASADGITGLPPGFVPVPETTTTTEPETTTTTTTTTEPPATVPATQLTTEGSMVRIAADGGGDMAAGPVAVASSSTTWVWGFLVLALVAAGILVFILVGDYRSKGREDDHGQAAT